MSKNKTSETLRLSKQQIEYHKEQLRFWEGVLLTEEYRLGIRTYE